MDTVYDAIIVGGGPAGLSAAIYMARARFHVLVIEKEKMGGQITITSEVVNYPGIFHTSGEKLTSEMIRQAKAFGAEFLSADVTALNWKETIRPSIPAAATSKLSASFMPAALIPDWQALREKQNSGAMA
mgnify:CR=1 FL=1